MIVRSGFLLSLHALVCLSAIFQCFQPAQAQIVAPGGMGQLSQNSYPNDQYYLALEIYREGNLAAAVEAFNDSLGLCRKDPSGRWVDAIPVYAMLAECFYQVGDLPAAIDNIDSALALAIRHRGWLSALDYNAVTTNGAAAPNQAAAWAAPNIPALVPTTNRMRFSAGSVNVSDAIAQGKPYQSAHITAMDAIEIMRGIAIASYRRRVICGPLSDQFDIMPQCLDATKRPANVDSTNIGGVIINAMRGCERYGGGADKEMEKDAYQATTIAGAVHPLSPILMICFARSLAETDKYSEAITLSLNAASAASALGQPELVGEAMMVAAGCIDQQTAQRVYVASSAAANAHLRRGPLASIGCMLAATESALAQADATRGQQALTQVSTMLQQRDVMQPRLAAHGEYLTALAAAMSGGTFGNGTASPIDNAISRMLNFTSGNGPAFRKSNTVARRAAGIAPASPRIYQLGMLTTTARNKGLGGKAIDEKIKLYAADPSTPNWRLDPVDALAYHAFDRSQIYVAQIVSAIKRNAPAELPALVDSLQRHRFLLQLSLGGRVLQARRLGTLDKTLLTAPANAFVAKPPLALDQLTKLAALPSPEIGTPAFDSRASQLEAMSTVLSLQRVSLPHAAPPPIHDVTDLKRLGKDEALLVFADVGGNLIAFLYSDEKVQAWNVAATKIVQGDVARVLKELGVSAARGASRFGGEEKWPELAVTLRRRLIPDEQSALLDDLTKLYVVPAGPLWYLPFELLPTGDANSPKLGEELSIQYAPTPGLAVYPAAHSAGDKPIGVVSSLFFAPRDGDKNTQMVSDVVDSLKASTKLPPDPVRPISLIGDTMGGLAVLGVTTPIPAQPMTLAPAAYDASDPRGTLLGWMSFPGKVPRSVALFGYRTAATNPGLGDGQELFLTLTALHSAGVRDVLISRWAVGGESTSIVAKEYLQELPFTGPLSAWSRAVQALRAATLHLDTEPLLSAKDGEKEEIKGDHPLFWAGYLISSPKSGQAAK